MGMDDDIVALLRRFARMDDIIGLGAAELAGRGESAIAEALAETCVEAVRVAEVALRVAAEDEFWPALAPLAGMWGRLGELADLGRRAGAPVPLERAGLDAVARGLHEVGRARRRVQAGLAELAAHPGDRPTGAAVQVAIDDLLRTGDALVLEALAVEGTGRLDATVAVLTAVAAAAGRARRERLRLTDADC